MDANVVSSVAAGAAPEEWFCRCWPSAGAWPQPL